MTATPHLSATARIIENVEKHSLGEIRISAARRVGARAGALAGLTAGLGLVAAATVLDHTTPSVAGFRS